MSVTTGQLDRRVTVEVRSVTRDAALGAEEETWAADATVWARVRQSSTAAGLSADDAVASYARPTKVVMRWRALTRQDHRLVFDGQVMRIIGTAEIGRRDQIEVSCMEWAHD